MILGIACVLTGVACNEIAPDQGDQTSAKPIVLTKSQTVVMEKGNDFAFRLLQESQKEFEGQNLFLSPMGVTIVSSMLANGAEGATYDEIVEAIGLKGCTLDQVNDCYSTLVTALYKADPTVSFTLANSLWVAQDLSLKKKFCENMKKTFDAESYSVDFSASRTLGQVNEWCSKKTNGLIPKMFERLSPLTQMLLINALYFKGDWVYSFAEEQTYESDFATLAGGKAKAQFMMMKRDLAVYQGLDVSIVKLPYGNGAFLMEAIVPNGDFSSFLSSLSFAQLQRWDQMVKTIQAELHFPKITAEFDTDEGLVPVLERLGMKKAFSASEADFSNMANEYLYVSNFRQKTYVRLDEKGTEAAAVTVAEMRKNSYIGGGPLCLLFDRPFVYLIREQSTGAILFIGTKVK
ncbi:MAG: serpin family protein [Bacteroidales bacterium]|nr:serpin family protein [Bacteroidales bacterium]